MEHCELCEGDGWVAVYGYVYPNEPHQAPIDTQTCLCQEEYDED